MEAHQGLQVVGQQLGWLEDGHERGLTNGHQGVARGREVTTHIGWGIPPISWEGATVFENERHVENEWPEAGLEN